MTEQIFFFLVYIFSAVIAYIYFSENYELKYSQSTSLLISVGLYSIGFLVNLVFNNNFIINDIAFLSINLLYCQISFNMSFKSGLFHSSILLAIMFITELIVEASASFLFNIPIDAYKNSVTALVILGIICKILYFTVCKIISALYSYKKNNAANDIKKNIVLFIYPIITTAMLSVFLYASANYKFSRKMNLICVILSIISLLFCCIIFIINKNFQKQENEIISLQSELDEHKYIGKTKNKILDLILDRYTSICNKRKINLIVDIRASI